MLLVVQVWVANRDFFVCGFAAQEIGGGGWKKKKKLVAFSTNSSVSRREKINSERAQTFHRAPHFYSGHVHCTMAGVCVCVCEGIVIFDTRYLTVPGRDIKLYKPHSAGFVLLPKLCCSFTGIFFSSACIFLICSCQDIINSVCVCVCVFIKLHITAQSGLVILVILCHSR